ncbi:MAG: hypothetical protein IPN65_03530 [Elusimicrobia bacterium]|jgi:hypothetical protein|nr:hypothetical protein [Elusimicrobiota bacterium]MBK7208696.1 hypothetical protein [Elusimicrobiota bacterium]MBK7545439.1 hypothetical protein [Elusimicrobiota bacterium]MBK7575545.1 hypothetical protein [Elusimicrobiota bacterium]MBK7688453.1 hypothetical protein [Elusimicrobiota bacterium]
MTRRERVAVSLVMVVGGVFFLQRFLWGPHRDRRQFLDAQIVRKTARIRRLERLWAARSAIKEAHKRLSPGQGAAVLSREDGLKNVERLARRCGVSIRDLRPLPGSSTRNIEVTTEGAYGALSIFIDALENGSLGFGIDKLTVDRMAGALRPLRARFTLRFE